MYDVFINYRTGDGDEAAAMIEKVLSERFGKKRIFRAARSIAPGSPYPEALLDAVRHSAILVAVIGANGPNTRSCATKAIGCAERSWKRTPMV